MSAMPDLHRRLCREDAGATATEYALMAMLIAVAIIGTVGAVGETLSGLYDEVGAEVAAVAGE